MKIIIKMSLVHKDIDSIIAKYVVVTGKPAYGKIINCLMIIFKTYPEFVKECHKRYMKLLCLYNKLSTPFEITSNKSYLIHYNNFWRNTIKKFESGVNFIIDGGQKSRTRKKLYMLGYLYGYRHVVTGQESYEKRANRGPNSVYRLIYSEEKIGRNKKYTMRELKRLRMNLPDMWVNSGEVDKDGNILYNAVEDGWGKRGIMYNTPGIIHFYKSVGCQYSNEYYKGTPKNLQPNN